MADDRGVPFDLVPNIKVDDVMRQAKKLRSAIQGALDATEGKELTATLDSMRTKMEGLADKTDSVSKRLQELEQTKVPTEDYAKVTAELSKTEEEYQKIVDKMAEMETRAQEEGKAVDYTSKKYQDLAYQLDMNSRKQGALAQDLAMMEEHGEAFIPGTATEEYDKLIAQQEQLNDQMRIYTERWNEANARMGTHEAIQETTELRRNLTGVMTITRSLGRIVPGMNTRIISGIVGIGRALKAAIVANPAILAITAAIIALSAAISFVIKKFKSLKESAKELADHTIKGLKTSIKALNKLMLETYKQTAKVIGSLYVGFGKILITLGKLAFSGVRQLINKLKSLKGVVSENLKLIAKSNNGLNSVNTALSNLTSSLAYLKGSLATAFAPILTYIEPMLTRFIDRLAELISMIGMFFAKITGAKSFIRAKRIQNDYADSISGVGDAADEASEKLASYDKLEVIQQDKSSGGGGAGGEVGFEEVPIDNDILDKLKEFLKSLGDLGTAFGEKLRDFLEGIPWSEIKQWSKLLGEGIADFINGFVEVERLPEAIGKTLGEIINTFNVFFNAFFTELHWDSLGEFIGKSFQTMLDTIDWKHIGRTLSEGFNGAMDAIKNFADEFDGRELGDDITDLLYQFVTGIKWDKVQEAADGIATDLAGIINGIFEDKQEWAQYGITLKNTFDTIVKTIHTFFIELDGMQIGTSLGTLIDEALDIDWGEVEATLEEAMTDLTGFINSLVTPDRFAKIGTNIANGLNTAFSLLRQFAERTNWDQVMNSIVTGLKNFFTTFKWKEAGESINTFLNNVLDAIQKELNNMTDEDWEEIGKKVGEFLSEIDWETLGGKIKDISDKLYEGLKTAIKAALKEVDEEDIVEFVWIVVGTIDRWKKVLKDPVKMILKAFWENFWEAVTADRKFNSSGMDLEKFFPGRAEKHGAGHSFGEEVGTDIVEGMAEPLKSPESYVKESPFQKAFDWINNGLREVFDSHSPAKKMEPLGEDIINGILQGFGLVDFAAKMTEWWNSTVAPWLTDIKENIAVKVEEIKTSLQEKWMAIKEGISTKITEIKDNLAQKWELIKAEAQGKIELIKATVLLGWENLKNGTIEKFNILRDKMVEAFNSIKDRIKAPINSIIGFVESMVNGIVNGVNSMIDKLNGLKISVPKGAAKYLGTDSIGFNIPKLSSVSIPRLAQGAVIPPNKEFAAILGDQRSGTNIETPLETMMEAFRQVLAESSGSHEPIILKLNSRTVAQAVWDEENKRYKQTGSYQAI